MQIRPDHHGTDKSSFNAAVLSKESHNDAEVNSKPASRAERSKDSIQTSKSSKASGKRTAKTNQPGRFAEQSGAEATTITADLPTKPKKRKVDCPVHKYYTMVVQRFPSNPHRQHASKPPCGGCRQEYMSQIRHHLKSSEKHRNFFSILHHCERCHEYVVERHHGENMDDQAWTNSNHKDGTCIKRDESRERLVVCWARLYLAIFPGETSVPSPCKYL